MMTGTGICDTTCDDYRRIERSIRHLAEHFRRRPSLAEAARAAHLSEFHFQRLFRRWAGVSPKRFVQFLTVEYAKRLLAESADVLSASHEAGLSGPGRLHDAFVALEAVTPGEYKSGGAGVTVRWGVHPTPLGRALVAVTPRGLCGLHFVEPDGEEAALAAVRADRPRAEFREDPGATAGTAARLFGPGESAADRRPLTLHVAGTNFQIRVWEALLRIPEGRAVGYGTLAAAVGCPRTAARAVGRACAANPVAVLIPCHRVLREVGGPGGYRWGLARKLALLGREAAARNGEPG